jgi:pantoate--beta-alanine ligase
MECFTNIDEQRAWSRAQRQAGKRVAFVPTMGALHAGHISLMERARQEADVVVVSIYLNPTQFDNPADLAEYPTSLEDDLRACAQAGVDAVFTPEHQLMYPNGFATFVEVTGPINEHLCAVTRPGHFRGVVTVVCKLFNLVEPDVAVFGEKDLQQVLIIARLIEDLNIPVQLVVAPTVREADGLAMSSRNQRLSREQRLTATAMPQALQRANNAFLAGERDAGALMTQVAEQVLMHPGVELDYAEVIDPSDWNHNVAEAQQGYVLAMAIFIGDIRLIDHIALGLQTIPVAEGY